MTKTDIYIYIYGDLIFSLLLARISCRTHNRSAGDLRRHGPHCIKSKLGIAGLEKYAINQN